RNRGCISVELKDIDKHILESFVELTPYKSSIRSRTRDTNFLKSYTSIIWSLHDWEAREIFKAAGLPAGSKSNIIKPPTQKFSEPDYVRGLIDADGSVGLTGNGKPFVSFTTKSDAMMQFVRDYIMKITGVELNPTRNTRDNIYSLN